MRSADESLTGSPVALREAYALAIFSGPVLLVYVTAQASLSFFLAPHHPALKLVLEPYLLLLGLILHVQWRHVSRTFQANDLPRPWWVLAADCLSFVTTFWALCVLVEAFLHQAKVI
jgi:hypothetical protein